MAQHGKHRRALIAMAAVGTFETSTDVRYATAFGGKADISQRIAERDL